MERIIQQYCPDEKTLVISELTGHEFNYTLSLFDKQTLAFLNSISRLLLTDKTYNRHPEIAALGFWLRETNVRAMQKENALWLDSALYSVNPLGLVFHVAPSNVDTIFLYSACISLLTGNRNIIRISSSRQSQVIIFIINCINKALQNARFKIFSDYIKIITYPHNDSINKFISSNVNCRVIWGGDSTVSYFKGIPGAVYTKDILFPNRISYSLFDAKAWLNNDEKKRADTAYSFFNDAYTFDQLGCSSPRIIYVLGSVDEKNSFINDFYKHLSKVAEERYHEQAAVLSTQKFNLLADDAIAHNKINALHSNNAVYMLEANNGHIHPETCVGGYFYIKHINSLKDIANHLPQSAQTLTYSGISHTQLAELNTALFGKRIDRIVPVGQALAFNYIWDGMNLFEELSRKRYLELKKL